MTAPKGAQSTVAAGVLPPAPPRRRVARIVHSPDAKAVGRVLALDGPTWLIGREAQDLGRVEDPRVSREHLKLRRAETAYVIEDLETRNGTFVNGKRLSRPTSLLANDVVAFGDTLLVADEDLDPDALPARDDQSGESAGELMGISFSAERMRRAVATAGSARASVLLLGPTGSGKEVAARAIHRLSERSGGPFIPVNCGAIPPELAEAELFGAKKGAFTGADKDRDGLFFQATGGTIFLDEVGDLPPQVQVKLLRVLEDGIVTPLGAPKGTAVDARVIAATHKNVADPAAFRTDLLARMSGWILRLPALEKRKADVLVLFRHFIERELEGRPIPAVSAPFAEALLLHRWPMNVREVRNLAQRVAMLAQGAAAFEVSHLPEEMQKLVQRAPLAAPPSAEGEGETEGTAPPRAELEAALEKARGNVTKAAKRNGWHKTQVYRWLKRYGVDPAKFRDDEDA